LITGLTPDHRGSINVQRRSQALLRMASHLARTSQRHPSARTSHSNTSFRLSPHDHRIRIIMVPARQSLERRIHSAKRRRFRSVPVSTRPLE
jgi:hypothetical protein